MSSWPKIPQSALGPLALGSLLILLAALFAGGRTTTRFAPNSAVQLPAGVERPMPPGATPTPWPLSGNYTGQMGLLRLSVAEGLLDPQAHERVAVDLDQALAYVVQRTAMAPQSPLDVYVGLEPGCGLHGIAYTDVRRVQVFTCPTLPLNRAVNILAHEFVHQLCHDYYGDRHLQADLVLAEGIATWGAGRYWLGDAPHFRAFVAPWLSRGEELPLGISYVGLPISDMNKLYYQWASFVEYLIETYGREAFDALYVTGQGQPGSADYVGTYGRNFDELEAAWKAWVLQG
ncbi:hypothetical protein EYB53_023315 [Candidatus Chloroploca sp. M-50]|uniref:DUF2268 domain-containing protein n=1 Tax=Candidatus Chloroploca mongolica TaxID=2528176 RepID=A0ABS4DGV2_9CHLR|nr:hypothetical protein [Candidatus Chloroploca mongolica]MBP1468663.1 hypothetical protein [Candidatus Chloroploca mongolica]